MSRTFKTVDDEAILDVTIRLGDCVPPNHLARFIVDTIAHLDLSTMDAHYGARGGQPSAPEILLGLLFYGDATGVFSTRKLERAPFESVPFRCSAGHLHPDHDTLAAFRTTFLPALKDLVVQRLLLAQAAGVLKLGVISLDGPTIHADASKSQAVSQTPPAPPGVSDFTDPASRIMKNSTDQGFDQHDKAQVAVAQASMLIVGESRLHHPNAQAEAAPTLDSMPPERGTPAAAALDAGYCSAATSALFARRPIAPYLATGRAPHPPSWRERFAVPLASPPDDASPPIKRASKRKTALGKTLYSARK